MRKSALWMTSGGRFIFSQSDAVLRQPRPRRTSGAAARSPRQCFSGGVQSFKDFSKFLGIKPPVVAQRAKLILQSTRETGELLLNSMILASHVHHVHRRDCKFSIYFNIDGWRRNLSKKTCHNAPI